MNEHPNFIKLVQVLKDAGDLYSFQDILGEVERGKMQSFSTGESLVITRISVFPRRRVLEIIAAAGTLEELKTLQNRIYLFALENDCASVMAMGRSGWERLMSDGWTKIHSTYMKDL